MKIIKWEILIEYHSWSFRNLYLESSGGELIVT